MNTKFVALATIFASVAIALNAVRIPTVFYPGSFFQFSQIPIVIAFLLFGARIGFLVGLLNLAGGLALFPIGPVGLIAYPMDFVSLLLMFAGMWLENMFTTHSKFPISKKPAFGLTLGATGARAGIMPFVDYAVVYHVLVPLILGLDLPQSYILGLVPAFFLYNVVVPLYTVPIAYIVGIKVNKHLKKETSFLR